MDWQPIETAPMVPDNAPCGTDGPYVLVCNKYGTWVASHCPVYVSGYRPENPWHAMMLNTNHLRKKPNGEKASLIPTHWMPLPKPPVQS